MKVLLIKSVEDLGLGGDVVEVSDGYARNYLFPRNLAIKASPAAVKSAEIYRAKALSEREKTISEAKDLAGRLNNHTAEIRASADENGHLYGSVNEKNISMHLKDAGFDVDAGQIIMTEHLKNIGDYKIQVKVYGEIRADLAVKILPLEEE